MPFGPDDVADPGERHRLSALMVAVTDDDFVRHEPPPDLWGPVADRIASDELDARRRRRSRGGYPRTGYLLSAAAVVVAVAVGSAVTAWSRSPSERVVARATLQQLEPLGDTSASARLVTKGDSTRLVVEATAMPPAPAGESYELWLIDTEVSDPRSLGAVSGSEEVTVPPSIDPRTHPIVDISLEPNDGDHHHSGHSLMRGTLN